MRILGAGGSQPLKFPEHVQNSPHIPFIKNADHLTAGELNKVLIIEHIQTSHHRGVLFSLLRPHNVNNFLISMK